MSGLAAFVHELRRRRVIHTAVLSIIAAWAALQISDLALPGLGIPEDAIRYVWIGAFLGFPLALLFGWRYQTTSAGIVRTGRAQAVDSSDRALQVTDYMLLSGLCVLVGVITYGLILEIRNVEMPARSISREIVSNSLAVLPLENFTGDPEQDYFVSGIHDVLIADLSKIDSLKVISRTSTNVYKHVVQPLPEIARQLGVANIVEGSVFRSGDNVRITVQLIDALSDEHLWAESYERDIEDVQ